ncbi:MAG: S8 family serine peptidase [Sphingobacteriaceae bacterium]
MNALYQKLVGSPKLEKYLLLAFFLLLLPCRELFAQVIPTNTKELNRIARVHKNTADKSRKKAYEAAERNHWTTFKVFENGKVMSLQSLDATGHPLYLVTDNNSYAAATTRANKLYTNGGLGLNLSGSSNFLKDKIGEWDGGSVYVSHQEFATDRILNKQPATAVSQHSTHVAGTIMAAGINPNSKGMAFGLQRLVSYDFNGDAPEMAAEAANGMLLSNHSYGYIAGWYYNSSPSGGGSARWEWYGNDGAYKDYKFGLYDSSAQSYDNICYQAPFYLPVKSAGNNRGETGPAVGQTYYKEVGGTWTQFTRQAGDIYSNDSYDCISLSGNAKNILTVGAISGIPNGPFNASTIQISSFSSFGPTDDGRIKPDIVGMGVSLTSTIPTGPTAYGTLSGTSMAAPNVTGTLVLLQEAYAQKNASTIMRSATLKGLVIHTADDGGTIGPDYIYGWGLANAEKAAKVILGDGTTHRIIQDELSQGTTKTISLISSGSGPLIATICWTDPAGTPGNSNDDRTPKLVNDLDLRLNDGIQTYRPWILDPDQPASAATTGDNFRDNVEQIIIANAIPGKTYTLTIGHKGNLSSGKQAYSLILSGVGGSNYCASAPTSTADSKISSFSLANINYTETASACTGYTDLTNQTIQVEAGANYLTTIGLGTCGANKDKRAKLYIDFNNDGLFDETTELAASSNLSMASSGNTTFSTTINIPSSVTIGNTSRARVVVSEVSNASSISACGSYANGETLDINIKFNAPNKDVGVNALIDPLSGTCSKGGQTITVNVKNFGTSAVSGVGLIAKVYTGNSLIGTLTGSYSGSINPGMDVNITTTTGFNILSSTTYLIDAETSLSGDLNPNNNILSSTITTSTPPAASNLLVTKCENASLYTLSGSSGGTIFWYKNAEDALPIAFNLPGQSATYTEAGSNITTFHAGVNNFSGKLGPATNTVFGVGGTIYLSGNNPSVLMKANAPVVLESARLYIGAAGKITFIATKTSTGAEVSRVTLDVTPNGAIGQVYPLNLELPEAGDYTVSIEYQNGASIFRNNQGVSGYPFKLGDVFSITGNTASDPAGVNTNYYQAFYYYFYDLAIRSAGCTNTQRTAVNTSGLIAPNISRNGNVLTSSAISGNQWFLNGISIPGATSTSYTATQAGTYTVQNTVGTCTVNSAPVIVGVNFPLAYNNFNTIVIDETCRANNNGSITITAAQALSYTASVTTNGQTTNYPFVTSLTIPGLSAGTYGICITADGNTNFKICYSIVVGEPKDLAVLSQVNPVTNSVILNLAGANTYQIQLNGQSYQTSSNSITLPLQIGNNRILVTTDKPCQGTFDEAILVNDRATIYPNPFGDTLFIKLGGNQTSTVGVNISNSSGTKVFQQTYQNATGTLQINVSNLESGFYLLTVGDQTYKIFKK